jgi:hypothetical protein
MSNIRENMPVLARKLSGIYVLINNLYVLD